MMSHLEENDMESVPASKLAAVFIKIRDKRAEIRKQYEAEDRVLKEQMGALEAAMLEKCKEDDASSISTAAGTIVRTIRTRYWPADWEAFKRFCLEHDSLDLFEKSVQQTNMAQWVLDNPEDIPPGLNIERKYTCTVRRK